MKDAVRSTSKTGKQRKHSRKINAAPSTAHAQMPPAESCAQPSAASAAAATATAAAATAPAAPRGEGGSNALASFDPVGLIGAEAYLLEDVEQIKQQRRSNEKIRALLNAAKGARNTSQYSSNVAPRTAAARAAAAAPAAAQAAAPAGGSTHAESEANSHSPAPPRVEREGPPLPLPDFALLPELPECGAWEEPRPLRPWQLQQHQQLLLLQQRQLQRTARKSKAEHASSTTGGNGDSSECDSGGGVSKEGDQPQLPRRRRETASAAAFRGTAAVAAAGAAAAAAGADFFGRLHAECVAAVRLLRPTEEEERLKRKAAARVRAVCRSLWHDCSVEIFGSSFTALGLPGSDLDLCVFAEMEPPLHVHYACSRCLCCSSSSSSKEGNSSPSSSSTDSSTSHVAAHSRGSCGRDAADTSCCCGRMARKRSSAGSSSTGLCSSNCHHGGSQGLRDVLYAAEEHRDLVDSCFRREAEFARCLRELNQAATAAKRQGSDVGPKQGRFADSIEPVVSARVPICKFKDAETGVSVDVSFDQPSAVLTSLYVRHRLKEFALLHPLILLNKMLLRHWRLHEPFKGGVGSYLVFVMCLHFLQNNTHLRDTKKLRHVNLGHLLFNFLHYFGLQFNYEASSISVRGNGSLRSKSSRARGPGLWRSREERMMLSAESPLDPSRDLGCSAFKIMQVRAAWRQAFLRLAARLMAEVRQSTGSTWNAATEDPLLSCAFGSHTWAEELGRHAESRDSSSGEALTATRPGLWVSKTLAASEETLVESLMRFSPNLRRWLGVAGDQSSSASSPTLSSISSDSVASCGMRRRPWERKQQQQQQQHQNKKDLLLLPRSKRFNTHVIFDSSESESSTASATPLPVRGFTSSRSSSPSVFAISKEARTQAAAPTTAATTAASSVTAASSPVVIDVEDSSSSGSSVDALRLQARREANRQKRKRRKQRQAAEARKRMRS
ncbi:hypothetical protein ACSSS7_003147 [Eimeria intestinalis]